MVAADCMGITIHDLQLAGIRLLSVVRCECFSVRLQDIARALSENLLIDSPVIRRILNV